MSNTPSADEILINGAGLLSGTTSGDAWHVGCANLESDTYHVAFLDVGQRWGWG